MELDCKLVGCETLAGVCVGAIGAGAGCAGIAVADADGGAESGLSVVCETDVVLFVACEMGVVFEEQ